MITARGKIVLTLAVLMAGVGSWLWWQRAAAPRNAPAPTPSDQATPSEVRNPGPAAAGAPTLAAAFVETQFETPQIAPPGVYLPRNDTLEIELSEYAGYAGLILANGGFGAESGLHPRQEVRLPRETDPQ